MEIVTVIVVAVIVCAPAIGIYNLVKFLMWPQGLRARKARKKWWPKYDKAKASRDWGQLNGSAR